MNVFPNPNNGTFSIQITSSEQGNVAVQVLDLVGREVFQISGTFDTNLTFPVNLEFLAEGQYIVKAKVNDQVLVQRVLIHK
jgi:hypothetical protein